MSEFFEKCWKACKRIPKGKVTTYKYLAMALNSKGYRAVGNAMNKNRNAPIVPCHRVVASDGSLHGYSFGLKKKKEILKKEGIEVKNSKVVDFEKKLYKF